MLSLIPQHQYGLWIFGLAVAVAITLLLLATQNVLVAALSPVRRRLRALRGDSRQEESGVIAQIGAYVSPRDQKQRETLSLMLVHAGWRSPQALFVMHAFKIVLVVLAPLAVLAALAAFPEHAPQRKFIPLLLLASAFLGWLLPNGLLKLRIQQRQEAIFRAFPDALDLLVACTEAGLGLNAAIERVANQIPLSHPVLAEELTLVNAEIRAGVDRSTALRNLSDRIGLKDVRGLVALIMHAMKFGTSIADTLRMYADDLRDRRVQHAEEMAAKIGTKLIFPMVVCIFPSFYLVAIGPAILGVLKHFS